MRKIIHSFFVFILLSPMAASAMPPHPKLLKEWKDKNVLQQKMAGLTARKAKGIDAPKKSFPASGNRKVCVLLIQYSDQPITTVSPQTFYGNLFNGGGSTTLTWKKYYQDMSNNTLNLEFEIYGPYTASNIHNYYGADSGSVGDDAHPADLVKEAIVKAHDAGVNFSQFDNDNDGNVDGIVVIHQGTGQEASGTATDIWSHRWSLSGAGLTASNYDGVEIDDYAIQPEYVSSAGDSTIGVFCHEFGHVLGLPDLYDTSYETDGVGSWSLMSAGSWNGTTGDGDVPAPLLAWERNRLGWATHTGIANAAVPIVDFSGIRTLPLMMLVLLMGTGFVSLILNGSRKRFATAALATVFISFGIVIQPGCGGGGGGGGGSITKTVSITDIDTSHNAIKMILEPDGDQYLLAENIVRKAGTWSEFLPGDGLLLTVIDDYWLSFYEGFNRVNYGNANPHGVRILEADGNDDLLVSDANSGDGTDTFYSGNATSISANTYPSTKYQKYDKINELFYSPLYSMDSGVSITDISVKGDTMTFTYSK